QRVFAREEPAFTHKAMSHVFPATPDTWHLTSIFEQTVRSNPSDRCRTAADLLQRINEVRYLIEHGYPPLEQLAERCPACGRKTLTDYHQGHRVFGNPKPLDIGYIICSNCGFAFARRVDTLREKIERLRGLR